MTKSENEYLDAICPDGSHSERAAARRMIRMMTLQGALNRKRGSDDEWVLATTDGRTLCQLADKSLGLDVGDNPQHWAHDRAQQLAERWNRTAFPKDRVQCIHWRDHYESQIERLKTDRR